jgi:hypothetical protein
MLMDGGILRSLGFNVVVLGSSYNRLLHEVDAMVVIDVAIYNDLVILSSKPNANNLCIRYHI